MNKKVPLDGDARSHPPRLDNHGRSRQYHHHPPDTHNVDVESLSSPQYYPATTTNTTTTTTTKTTTTKDLSKRLEPLSPVANYSTTPQPAPSHRPRKLYLPLHEKQQLDKNNNNNNNNEKHEGKKYYPEIMEADSEENQEQDINRINHLHNNNKKYAGKKYFPEIMEADLEEEEKEEVNLDNVLHPGAVAVRGPVYLPDTDNATLTEIAASSPSPSSPDVLAEHDLISAVLVSDENTEVLAPAIAIQESKVSRKCVVISVLMLLLGLLIVAISVVILVAGNSSNHKGDKPTTTSIWTKLGKTLTGEPYGKITFAFGSSISMSSDGNVVAVGNPFYVDETASVCGQVVIVRFMDNEWKQFGQILRSTGLGCWFGDKVSLSSDGTRLAVNDYNPWWKYGDSFGRVQVFRIQDNVWVPHGHSEGNHDSLSLSSNGDLVAVRQIHYGNGDDEKSREVKVFELTSSPTNQWTQQGAVALSGGPTNSTLPRYASPLSLSGDSTVLVTQYNVRDVQAYRWLESDNQWIPHGQLLQGETDFGEYGFSLSLSSEGTVLAVGAPLDEEVTVLELVSHRWEQKGRILQGKHAFDWFGWSVSLSSDGNIIAVGAVGSNEFIGQVEVDEFTDSEWQQQGQILHGEAANSWFGGSVTLSSNGTILAIGADGGGLIDGQVKVFQLGYAD